MGYFRGKPELNIEVLEEAQRSWLPTGSDHEQGVSEEEIFKVLFMLYFSLLLACFSLRKVQPELQVGVEQPYGDSSASLCSQGSLQLCR